MPFKMERTENKRLQKKMEKYLQGHYNGYKYNCNHGTQTQTFAKHRKIFFF